MEFPLTEPTNSRYLYIHPETNRVYVLMPIVSGTQIGLDNTCKSVFALQAFFGKSRDVHQRAVLDELKSYKKALEFDMSLLDDNSAIKTKKQERFQQIKQYLEAIEAVLKSDALNPLSLAFPEYPAALQEIMKQPEANLYSMVLRPKAMDSYLRFVKPVFSLKRGADGSADESAFYKTLSKAYRGVSSLSAAKAKLYKKVLDSKAAKRIDFLGIRFVLQRYVQRYLEVNINFRRDEQGHPVTQASIDAVLGASEESPVSAKEYVDALLGACAPQLFDTLNESPFYTRQHANELSIITQFFMANVNIFCRMNGLSTVNFGPVLDNSKELSEHIAAIVLSIYNGDSIEDALLEFVNKHKETFGLTRELTPVDQAQIKKQFTQHYSEIKKSPHFDEFICLDDSKNGSFVSHQGSICLNLAQFIRQALPEHQSGHFERIHAEFKTLKKEEIKSTNPSVHATVELSIEALASKITDEDQLQAVLKKLPKAQQDDIMASPQIKRMQVQKFLLHVARGERAKAKAMLQDNPNAQILLQTKGTFTDYSGRTFDCTAYEYAYWAKDTHMQRILEEYICKDEDTKAQMLSSCEAIEAHGLTYTQAGAAKNSKHFDFTPLKTALQEYVNGYNTWYAASNWDAMKTAWMKVGKAQRDVPVHVANEYCRKDRSFDPLPKFDEASLPEELTFYNFKNDKDEAWFPFADSPTSGLGVDFALYRAAWGRACRWAGARRRPWGPWLVDLAAVSHLDKVRTDDLTQSRENLRPMAQETGMAMT